MSSHRQKLAMIIHETCQKRTQKEASLVLPLPYGNTISTLPVSRNQGALKRTRRSVHCFLTPRGRLATHGPLIRQLRRTSSSRATISISSQQSPTNSLHPKSSLLHALRCRIHLVLVLLVLTSKKNCAHASACLQRCHQASSRTSPEPCRRCTITWSSTRSKPPEFRSVHWKQARTRERVAHHLKHALKSCGSLCAHQRQRPSRELLRVICRQRKVRGSNVGSHASVEDSTTHIGLRRRRGSVPTMTPHQYWTICGLKSPKKETNQSKLSSLSPPTCTHRRSGKPSFRLWPSRFRKVARPPSNLLNYTQNKEAHKRNKGTPSFPRKHTMFKLLFAVTVDLPSTAPQPKVHAELHHP